SPVIATSTIARENLMSMIKTSTILLCAALAAAPAMALAESSNCSVDVERSSCRTGVIPANPEFHFVQLEVQGTWQRVTMVDVETGIPVLMSPRGEGVSFVTVFGLFSRYAAFLEGERGGAFARVTLSNGFGGV